MATSNQKRLSMNRFNWNSKMTYLSPQVKIAVEILSESKMGVSCISPKRRSFILDLPGAIFLRYLRHKGCNRHFPFRRP
jgi:hypothetical protein